MIQLLKIETNRLLLEMRNYKLNYILSSLDVLLICLGIFLGTGSEIFPSGTLFYGLIGMILWRYTIVCLQTTCSMIQQEIRIGILDQLLLTKYSLEEIVLIRLIAKLFVESIRLLLVSILLIAGFRIKMDGTVNYIIFITAFLICIVGMLGISYIVAGITLIYKKANALVNVINYFTLFFTGMMIPLEVMPRIFSYIACILPFYWCVETMKENAFGQNMVFLILTALVWLGIGFIWFHRCLYRVIADGSTSRY